METHSPNSLLTIDEVEAFIRSFIDAEYRCEYAKWDITVSDEAHQPYEVRASSFVHRTMSDDFSRSGMLNFILESPERRAIALNNLNHKLIPRTLFRLSTTTARRWATA